MARPQSPEVRRGLELFAQGVPIMQAAKLAGCGWRALSMARKRAGLRSRWKRLDAKAIAAAFNGDLSVTAAEIAAAKGTTESTVYTYASAHRERQSDRSKAQSRVKKRAKVRRIGRKMKR